MLGSPFIEPLHRALAKASKIPGFSEPRTTVRIPDDLAIRARNWFWYWQVRSISGMSNYQLDAKCFGRGGAERKRYFERIEMTASDPDRMAMVNGRNVLAVVDRWTHPETGLPGAFKPATAGFRSKFWEFLTTVNSNPKPYSDFIQAYVVERRWVRLQVRDSFAYRTFYGRTGPALEEGVSTAYSAMLHKLVNEQSLDAAAVLIALFREAVHASLLKQAIAIKHALRATISLSVHDYGMPRTIELLIWHLVHDRVFTNVRISEDDWRRATGTRRKSKISTAERAREFQDWVRWYIGDANQLRRTGYGYYPIVPSSPRLRWLLQNREQLDDAAQRIGHCEAEAHNLGDYESGRARQEAESLQREAQGLQSKVTPPQNPDERFYDKEPPMTLGDLPRPY